MSSTSTASAGSDLAPGTAPTFHSEHVGSLLRPPALLAARAQHRAGLIDDAALTAAEDAAVLDVLAFQRDIGIDVVTDGEYRRGWFGEGLYRAVDGLEAGPARSTGRVWVGAGDAVSETAEQVQKELVASAVGYTAVRRLSVTGRIAEHEASFLRQHAHGSRYKVTTMAPAAHAEGWFVAGAAPEYPRGVDLLADLALLLRDEAVALAADGVPYVQVDSLSYILRFGDAGETARFLSILGVGQQEAIDAILAADNLILDAVRAAGATTGVHMCRGNSRSAWNAKAGTYDVATRALAELRTDRLLLEYDSDRAGSFAPLAHVPDSTTVVLGLVTSKFGELERRDDLLRRIEEAATYHPVDRLAISPQCGFASTAPGNLLTWDDQRRKLELVTSVAHEVWGDR
ncbi:MAG TPA: cobalamin-independent methionine synthase II family protein [Cellulomonas sp.]